MSERTAQLFELFCNNVDDHLRKVLRSVSRKFLAFPKHFGLSFELYLSIPAIFNVFLSDLVKPRSPLSPGSQDILLRSVVCPIKRLTAKFLRTRETVLARWLPPCLLTQRRTEAGFTAT